jgi:hypothetical protein
VRYGILRERPGPKVLLLVGLRDETALGREGAPQDAAFLQKPFTPRRLSEKVRAVLDGRAED